MVEDCWETTSGMCWRIQWSWLGLTVDTCTCVSLRRPCCIHKFSSLFYVPLASGSRFVSASSEEYKEMGFLWETDSGDFRVFSVRGSTVNTHSRVSLRSFMLNVTHFSVKVNSDSEVMPRSWFLWEMTPGIFSVRSRSSHLNSGHCFRSPCIWPSCCVPMSPEVHLKIGLGAR